MADARAKRREERVELAASALSNIGVAFIVAGWVGPSIAGRFSAAIALGAALLGFGLHLLAQCVLHYVVAGPLRDSASGGEQ